MLNGKFWAKMSAALTTLLLTLLVTTGQAKINQGETFKVNVVFNTNGDVRQPFPSSAEVVQGIQAADYGGGVYFPAAVKVVGVSSGADLGMESSAASKTFTVKITFFPTGNLLQPFPSSGEVVQGIQTADYVDNIYFPLSVTIVGAASASSGAAPLRDLACAATQELALTVKTAEAPMTNLDEFSCTASEGRWSFGFNTTGAQGRGTIEIRYFTGNLVYTWQHPIVLQGNVAINGCDPQGMNCWEFDQSKYVAWACQNCTPLMSYLHLTGALKFPAALDGAKGPDSVEHSVEHGVEPTSASGTN